MADVVNDNPMNSLSANVGHQFTSVASFAWMDPVNGARNQESTIDIVLQTKTVGQRKLLTLEGEIRLDSHSHTTAERFKLETFNITVVALHGTADPTRALEPHPIRCDSMAPNSTLEYAPTTQQTRSAGFTLNPSPTTLGQVHFITSTCRTYLGSSIRASQQRAHSRSDGTVWSLRVEDHGEKTFGGFLGTFSAGFRECAIGGRAGCSVDDPTSLSLTIEASFADTMAWSGASSKPIIQTVSVHYPTWPTLDEHTHAGQQIFTSYSTNFSGREVGVIQTIRDPITSNEIPQDVSYDMEVHRARGSGTYGRVLGRKLYSAMNVVGGTLKVVGKQIRRPSRILDMMVDREATRSASNP